MHCRVFACDFDGTIASNGQLMPEAAAALASAHALGFTTLLVTGRVHEEVEHLCTDLSMFDAVVAENGAVVCFPSQRRMIRLGNPPPAHFLGELRAKGVPFQAGAVVVGTWEPHAHEVFDLVRQAGIDSRLVFNRSAVMLLPDGINKAAGVRRALEELGRSEHNLVAFGDAENDLPLFALAEMAVAARGAVPTVAAVADEHLLRQDAPAVAQYIRRVLARNGFLPTPARHDLLLGRAADGTSVTLPASGMNVMISGDPRSGKSWILGLLAEQLIERDYRVCVIDPEGDYVRLGQRPRVLALGAQVPLPDPNVLGQLLRTPCSLVLHLTSIPQAQQPAYVEAALRALAASSTSTGLPHWILLDEAHYFFRADGNGVQHLTDTVNFAFATYRPSLMSAAVVDRVTAHFIAPTTVEEERYFASALLATRGPRDLVPADVLSRIKRPQVGLLIEDVEHPRWQVLLPSARFACDPHHGRKYADARLPEHLAFRFQHANGADAVAHNVIEFCQAVQAVPMKSLRHHFLNGDFSRWAADVLGDQGLARGLRKLERTVSVGATIDRSEILDQIADHYSLGTVPQESEE
jgi:hydroxymethylpyrimidine pyrophosphatase-like HAD family hydrolase